MTRPDPAAVERVAVIGAGTIGASWAALFLAHGRSVAVHDPAPGGEARVRQFVTRAWPTLERLGLAANADPDRISFHADPADAVVGAALIQESGPENLAAKQALYQRFETALDPSAVVASSTSGIMPSDLQAGRLGAERFLVGHPFNPPHLIPLVEVVGGQATDPAAVDWALGFYRSVGKRPIQIRREVPGHVANRLQVALYREAVHLVLEGVAGADDVDAAIAYGPGLRWALMGPHLTMHLAGGPGGLRHLLEHVGPGIQSWWHDLGQPDLTPDVVERLVAAFDQTEDRPIKDLETERDALLIALLETIQTTRRALAGSTGDATR